MSETMFYNSGNVTVTNARAVMAGKTYALANVTSVRKVKVPVNIQPFALLIIIGVIMVTTGLSSQSGGCLGLGALLIIVGIALVFLMKPSYAVVLGSASGENQSMTSQNEAEIDQIVAAISNAIVHRG